MTSVATALHDERVPELPARMDEVRRAASGDRAAARALFVELLPRVRNLVRYLVRGDAVVDDISQEALVAVLRGLAGFRGEGRFEAWVDRIVARTTFGVLGRLREEPSACARDEGRELPDPHEPDAYLARRQAVELLDRLPYAQRHALVLHHVLELTVPEIAAELGVPAETVRSRLRLGRDALRQWARDP